MIKSVENIISNLLPIYSDNSNWSSNKDIFLMQDCKVITWIQNNGFLEQLLVKLDLILLIITWFMYYQSGNAICLADSTGYSFSTSELDYSGCLCLLRR